MLIYIIIVLKLEIIRVVNILNISNNTLVNFVKVFGKKSKDTITNLENNFLNKIIEYTDETRTKFDKEKLYVRN